MQTPEYWTSLLWPRIRVGITPEDLAEWVSMIQADCGQAKGSHYHPDTRTVLHVLNETGGRYFRELHCNLSVISARLKEKGVDLEGVRKMLARQWQRWAGTAQAEYFRPETLFRPSNFDSYYAARHEPVAPVVLNGEAAKKKADAALWAKNFIR